MWSLVPQHVVIRLQRRAAGAMGLPRGGVGWGTGGEQSPVGGAPQSSLGRGVCKAERGPRGHSVLCSGSCEPSPRPISLELERGEERPLTPTALSWWPCGDHLLVEAQKQSGWSQSGVSSPAFAFPYVQGLLGQCDYSAHGKPGPGRAGMPLAHGWEPQH